MAHTQNRFLIPELNVIANDAELRKLQKQILSQQYQKDVSSKKKLSQPKKPYEYRSWDNPEHPMFRSQVQVNMQKNIREDLAHTYSEQMEKKEMMKRYEKQQERTKQLIALQISKEIAEQDRIRAKQMHENFKRQAMEQLHEKQMRKLEEKRRQQEEKQAYQRRYSTNLLAIKKQQSFREVINKIMQHYNNVNGAYEERQRNYMSTVIPMNNYRQQEKQRIIEAGINRSNAQLREQLQHQHQMANKYRQELRDSLTMQIREKEQKKRREIQTDRSQGYTSPGYLARHHPINNPVDFRITHDNKYIIGELQSGLARSGSKSLLQ